MHRKGKKEGETNETDKKKGKGMGQGREEEAKDKKRKGRTTHRAIGHGHPSMRAIEWMMYLKGYKRVEIPIRTISVSNSTLQISYSKICSKLTPNCP